MNLNGFGYLLHLSLPVDRSVSVDARTHSHTILLSGADKVRIVGCWCRRCCCRCCWWWFLFFSLHTILCVVFFYLLWMIFHVFLYFIIVVRIRWLRNKHIGIAWPSSHSCGFSYTQKPTASVCVCARVFLHFSLWFCFKFCFCPLADCKYRLLNCKTNGKTAQGQFVDASAWVCVCVIQNNHNKPR